MYSLMGVFVLIALILAIRYRVEKGTTAEIMLSRHGISGSITVACWLLQPIVAYFQLLEIIFGKGGRRYDDERQENCVVVDAQVHCAIFSVMFSIFASKNWIKRSRSGDDFWQKSD